MSKVRVDHLLPARFQPRQEFPEEVIAELAASMEQVGQNTPILIRPARPPEGTADADPWYELVCGESRRRAAKRLGWRTLWAVIEELSDDEAALRGMVDNEQRRSLNPIERAAGYLRLMNEYQLTQEKLCERSGIAKSTLSRLLKLLDEPSEIQEMIKRGTLTESHCRELDRIAERKKRVALAKEVCERGMSGQETAKRVRQVIRKKGARGRPKKDRPQDLATVYNGFRFWWEGDEVVVRAPNIRPDMTLRQYAEDLSAAADAFFQNEPRPGTVSSATRATPAATAVQADVSATPPLPSTTSASGTESAAQTGDTAQTFDPEAEAQAIAKSFKELGDIVMAAQKTDEKDPKK